MSAVSDNTSAIPFEPRGFFGLGKPKGTLETKWETVDGLQHRVKFNPKLKDKSGSNLIAVQVRSNTIWGRFASLFGATTHHIPITLDQRYAEIPKDSEHVEKGAFNKVIEYTHNFFKQSVKKDYMTKAKEIKTDSGFGEHLKKANDVGYQIAKTNIQYLTNHLMKNYEVSKDDINELLKKIELDRRDYFSDKSDKIDLNEFNIRINSLFNFLVSNKIGEGKREKIKDIIAYSFPSNSGKPKILSF